MLSYINECTKCTFLNMNFGFLVITIWLFPFITLQHRLSAPSSQWTTQLQCKNIIPIYMYIQKTGKPVEINELLGQDFQYAFFYNMLHHNCIAIYFKSTMQVDFTHLFFYICMMHFKYCRSLTI